MMKLARGYEHDLQALEDIHRIEPFDLETLSPDVMKRTSLGRGALCPGPTRSCRPSLWRGRGQEALSVTRRAVLVARDFEVDRMRAQLSDQFN